MSDDTPLRTQLTAAGAVFQMLDGDSVAAHFGDPTAEETALLDGVGVCDASRRTQIAVSGEDRAAFLHNMCTNEIRKLPVCAGCETFLTNAQGRILAYGHVFCEPDRLILETVPGQAAAIIEHLDRYIIREKVELADLTEERAELLLGGPKAGSLIQSLVEQDVPPTNLAHRQVEISGSLVNVRCVELIGRGSYLLDCPAGGVAELWRTLCSAGATPCGELAADAARIATAVPAYGRDITDKNLPQEIGRNRQAISFTKGCYIGQETVARIDALGHVNRLLVKLQFAGKEVPRPGDPLTTGGAEVGQVTSAAFCHRLQAAIALAYVRRGQDAAGTLLQSAAGDATVQPPATEGGRSP